MREQQSDLGADDPWVIGVPGPDLPRTCKRILDVRSTSPHSSLPARATGAFSRCPARLSGCRPPPVRRCAASILLTEPDTGLNRSSQRKSAGCSFNFFEVQLKIFLITAKVTSAKGKIDPRHRRKGNSRPAASSVPEQSRNPAPH